jgi:hypothetical protein
MKHVTGYLWTKLDGEFCTPMRGAPLLRKMLFVIYKFCLPIRCTVSGGSVALPIWMPGDIPFGWDRRAPGSNQMRKMHKLP